MVRVFANEAGCLRLVRTVAVAPHEKWLEERRYLNLAFLREHEKEQPRVRDGA